MATVGKLTVEIEGRMQRLEQDLAKASATVEKSAKRMEGAFGGLRDAATKALAGLSVGAAVLQLKTLFDTTLQGIDRLNDISDATGSTVENISALEDVAARTGSNIEVVSQALVKMNQTLNEARKPGSEAAAIYENLGLNVQELQKLDPAEAMLRLAQAFGRFADDGEKGRYLLALFGKSTREIAPLLKDLAEKGKLNATVTAEQTAAAEAWNKQTAQASKNLQDLGRALSLDVLEGLNRVFDAVQRLRERGGIMSAIWGQLKAETSANVASAQLTSVVADIESVTKALERNPNDGYLRKRLQGLRDDYTQLSRQAAAASDALKGMAGGDVWNENYGNEGRRARRSLPPPPSRQQGGSTVDEAERYLKNLRKQVESSLELTAVEKVRYDLANGNLKLSAGITEQVLIEQAEIVDRLKEEAKWQEIVNKAVRESADARTKEYEEAIKAAAANEEADRSRLRGLLDRTPGGQFAARQRDIDFLQRQLGNDKIDLTQYAEAIKVVAGITDEAQKGKSMAEELGMTFTSAFEDAIVGGKGLRDVLKGLEADILRIVTRKMVTEPLGNAITKMLGGGGTGGGSFFDSIGSWFGKLFAGGFADGGFIPPGRWGMTGERGPEPVFGGRTGVTVRPAGGMQVVQHFNVAGAADRRTQQQIAAAAARGLQMASGRGN